MTDTPPSTTPPNSPKTDETPLYLANEPSLIADFINRHKNTTDENAPPYSFADFVRAMNMTDFEDSYQMRAVLESQAHLLGTAFQYLMLEGDWKNLASAIRVQKIMHDTIKAMNHYPRLSDLYERDEKNRRIRENAQKMD